MRYFHVDIAEVNTEEGRLYLSVGIEHRLTKPNHPWANGQVERMNRALRNATVKRYHYTSRPNT